LRTIRKDCRIRERFASYLTKMLQRINNFLQIIWHDVTTYTEHVETYVKKMSLRIKNILKMTWRRGYNVSGTPCNLLEEHVTIYQERLARYSTKSLQRIRNVFKIVWINLFQRTRNVLQVTWGKCYNVSGMSWNIVAETVTTYHLNKTLYQERLWSYVRKMFQRRTPRCWQRKPQDARISSSKPSLLMCKGDNNPAAAPWAPSAKTWCADAWIRRLPNAERKLCHCLGPKQLPHWSPSWR